MSQNQKLGFPFSLSPLFLPHPPSLLPFLSTSILIISSFQPSLYVPFSIPSFLFFPPLPFFSPIFWSQDLRSAVSSPLGPGRTRDRQTFWCILKWKIGLWWAVTEVLKRFTENELQLQVTIGGPKFWVLDTSIWIFRGAQTDPHTPTVAAPLQYNLEIHTRNGLIFTLLHGCQT